MQQLYHHLKQWAESKEGMDWEGQFETQVTLYTSLFGVCQYHMLPPLCTAALRLVMAQLHLVRDGIHEVVSWFDLLYGMLKGSTKKLLTKDSATHLGQCLDLHPALSTSKLRFSCFLGRKYMLSEVVCLITQLLRSPGSPYFFTGRFFTPFSLLQDQTYYRSSTTLYACSQR